MAAALATAGVVAFAAVALLTPLAARVARRLGLLDQPSPQRAHAHPTPYLGGVAILTGILGAAALGALSLGPGVGRELAVILPTAAMLAGVGLLDDWRPHKPRYRILAEVGAAVAVVAAGVRLHVTGLAPLDVALTLAWIVGITNAVNLLDNMDGLASGAVATAAAGAAYIGLEDGQRLVPLMAVAIGAASAGFLVHNRPPARIFMGDAGSLALGFLLAVTVAKLRLVGQPGPLRLAVVALLCGVGILDTALVVASRLARHRSPFVGGTDHSSHRLVRSGLSRRGAVLALHAMSGWFVASAILVRRVGLPFWWGVMVVAGVVALGALWALLRLPAEGPLEAPKVG